MIIGLFIIVIGGFSWYNTITGGAVATIDDLHQMNYDGDLKEEQGYVYNGYSVVRNDKLWWTQVTGVDEDLIIPLHFGPKDLLEVEVSGQVSDTFNNGGTIYISIDPRIANQYYTLAVSELSLNMAQGIGRYPEAACTIDAKVCEGRQTMNCEDTKGNPVIEFVLGGEKPTVELDGSCIKLSGSNADLVKSVDRLLYKWYKVMK